MTQTKKTKYKSTVPAVDQAMQILNCFAESSQPQLTLTEICERMEIHKSKAYTILNTLVGYDFVEKNPQTKTYRLGLGIVYLARNILNNLDVRDLVTLPLQQLVAKTQLTAHYGMITGSRVYIVAKEESDEAYGYNIRVGIHHHITHGAHGKAIVAFMPEAEREEILNLPDDELEFYGNGAPCDRKKLMAEFEEIRLSGYAVDARETNPDIVGISSPVFDGGGIIRGAVLLVGIFSKAKQKKNGPLVANAAARISRMMGYRAI